MTIVLLVVLAVSATAHAAHFHAAEGDGHCQLCLMAHHSIAPAPYIEPLNVPTTVGSVYIAAAGPVMSRSVLTTRIRPPPISL